MWDRQWSSAHHGQLPSFHLPHVNPNIAARLGMFEAATREEGGGDDSGDGDGGGGGGSERVRLLVPLCGASLDLKYLAQEGFDVVGVDSAHGAITSLAAAGTLPHPDSSATATTSTPHFKCIDASEAGHDGLCVVQGDFMRLTQDSMNAVAGGTSVGPGPFDGAWDRGGVTSLPPPLRSAYVTVLHSLLRRDATVIMETMAFRDAPARDAVSLGEEGVHALFDGLFSVALDARRDVTADYAAPRPLDELVFVLRAV